MTKKALISIAVLAVGCGPGQKLEPVGLDQCMRREIFFECLRAVPPGPSSTQYNDWSEVVDECDSAALYQSKRPLSQIEPQCSFDPIPERDEDALRKALDDYKKDPR